MDRIEHKMKKLVILSISSLSKYQSLFRIDNFDENVTSYDRQPKEKYPRILSFEQIFTFSETSNALNFSCVPGLHAFISNTSWVTFYRACFVLEQNH